MSLEAIVASLHLPKSVGPTSRLVLIALANYADENDEAYPSHATLAELANLSESRVQTILRECVEAGWLDRSIQAAFDIRIPANRRPNLYRFTYVPPGARRGIAGNAPSLAGSKSLSSSRAEETREDLDLGVACDAPSSPMPVSRPKCRECVNGWVEGEKGYVPCPRCNIAEAS